MKLRELGERLRGDDKSFMPRWIIDSMLAQGNKLPDKYGPGMEGLPDLSPEDVALLEDVEYPLR